MAKQIGFQIQFAFGDAGSCFSGSVAGSVYSFISVHTLGLSGRHAQRRMLPSRQVISSQAAPPPPWRSAHGQLAGTMHGDDVADQSRLGAVRRLGERDGTQSLTPRHATCGILPVASPAIIGRVCRQGDGQVIHLGHHGSPNQAGARLLQHRSDAELIQRFIRLGAVAWLEPAPEESITYFRHRRKPPALMATTPAGTFPLAISPSGQGSRMRPRYPTVAGFPATPASPLRPQQSRAPFAAANAEATRSSARAPAPASSRFYRRGE